MREFLLVKILAFFGDIALSVDTLKCLSEGRHLHQMLVPIAAKLFEIEISSSDLATVTPSQLRAPCSIAELDWCSLSLPAIYAVASEAPHDRNWISPIVLPGPQRKWCFAILKPQEKLIEIRTDFDLNQKESEFLQKLAPWFGQLWSRGRNEQDVRWELKSFHRSIPRWNSPSEAAIWVLADIRSLLLGSQLLRELDTKAFRNRLRDLISKLPTTPNPRDPEAHDSALRQFALDMITAIHLLYRS